MKKIFIPILLLTLLLPILGACSNVAPGYVGVAVNRMGEDKGVDHEVLGVGYYAWLPWRSIYEYPTSMQTYVFTRDKTEQSPTNEEFSFTSKEGLQVTADAGISYSVDPKKVSILFQTFRQGISEITHSYIRNQMRDAMIASASKMPIESLYGNGKVVMMNEVRSHLREVLSPMGILVDSVYLAGNPRMDPNVEAAIVLKIQKEQEVLQQVAEANKAKEAANVAFNTADGIARAKRTAADAEAYANTKLSQSLTPELLRYQLSKLYYEKWNGVIPVSIGGGQGGNGNTMILPLPAEMLKSEAPKK